MGRREEEIKKAVKQLNPVGQRIAEDYLKIRVERDTLAKLVKEFEQKHNELYRLIIAILQDNGKVIEVSKDLFNLLPNAIHKYPVSPD